MHFEEHAIIPRVIKTDFIHKRIYVVDTANSNSITGLCLRYPRKELGVVAMPNSGHRLRINSVLPVDQFDNGRCLYRQDLYLITLLCVLDIC